MKTPFDGSARPGLPRGIDGALAALGLVVAAPLLIVLAVLVRLSSPGPALFRQRRVGRGGVAFEMIKLRSMHSPVEGKGVTAAGDPRVTGIGRWLRRTKLDELPALWNVVRGELALVGPRPEVPRFVHPQDPGWAFVLSVRPGLTDPTTLLLRDEEGMLQRAGGNPEDAYEQRLLPLKLRSWASYLRQRTAARDVVVLARTGGALLGLRNPAVATIEAFEALIEPRKKR